MTFFNPLSYLRGDFYILKISLLNYFSTNPPAVGQVNGYSFAFFPEGVILLKNPARNANLRHQISLAPAIHNSPGWLFPAPNIAAGFYLIAILIHTVQ